MDELALISNILIILSIYLLILCWNLIEYSINFEMWDKVQVGSFNKNFTLVELSVEHDLELKGIIS